MPTLEVTLFTKINKLNEKSEICAKMKRMNDIIRNTIVTIMK